MRVGVYVPDAGPYSGGALTFMREVLSALAAVPCGHEFHVLYGGPTPPNGGDGLPHVRVPEPSSPTDLTLDTTSKQLGVDIVWFLAPDSPPITVPFIVTVWDLEHRNHPYFPEVSVSGWTWEERELYYRGALPRAACVIAGTAEGKRQIEQFYSVPSSLIAVVPFLTPTFRPDELDEHPERLSELGVRPPYLFYPAQFWPHKNHVMLLRALTLLGERDQAVDLVLTGADNGNLGHVRAMAKKLGVENRVRFLGLTDRRTVVTLYRNAAALVFPSFFGPDNLPPLEAFALGCPVIAAAMAGSSEFYGDAAVLLDPACDVAWADAIGVLLNKPELRTDLVERGLARSRQWRPQDYVGAVATRLDALEPVRRCWSRTEAYVHPGAQPAASQEPTTVEKRGGLDIFHALESRLAASEADRAARLDVIRSLQAQLDANAADRAALLCGIQSMRAQLDASEADRAARLDVIHSMQAQLDANAADRAALLGVIQSMQAQLDASEADRAARLDVINRLQAQVDASEADRAARLEVIQAAHAELQATRGALERMRSELHTAISRIGELEGSRTWRWTRPVRRILGPSPKTRAR
jgi:glycosyltransferase involved in cell wall biosynthesis